MPGKWADSLTNKESDMREGDTLLEKRATASALANRQYRDA